MNTEQTSKNIFMYITLVINKSLKYKKMIRYSVQPRGQIFVNSYGFLSFAKIMGKDIATDVLASGTITVTEVSTGWENDNMEVVFENCSIY